MKKSLLFAFLILNYFGYSQNLRTVEVPRGSKVESTQIIDGVSTHNYATKSNIPINGTPYLKNDFLPGVLELHDGKRSDEVMLRFDIAKDMFEIIRENDTLTLNRPFAVKYIYLDDKMYFFDPKLRPDAPRKQNGYFQLARKGKLSLYVKIVKDLSYDSFANNYKGGSGTKEYYYVEKVSYVAQFNEGSPFLITSSKKLLAHLDDHKSEVKQFIKENKIKFKKEEDLIKVVEYYNNL